MLRQVQLGDRLLDLKSQQVTQPDGKMECVDGAEREVRDLQDIRPPRDNDTMCRHKKRMEARALAATAATTLIHSAIPSRGYAPGRSVYTWARSR